MRTAIAWLLVHGDGAAVLRLVARLDPYWSVRPNDAEARAWLEAGLATASTIPADVRAAAYYSLAARTAHGGDIRAALIWADKGLTFARSLDDPFVLARALLCVGWAWQHAGDVARGEPACAEAVALLRSTGDTAWLGFALVNLSEARYGGGDVASAVPLLDEALDLNRDLDDPHTRLLAMTMRAIVATAQGEIAPAVQWLGDAIAGTRSLGDRRIEMTAVVALAGVAMKLGQDARAAHLLGGVTAAQMAANTPQLYFQFHLADVTEQVRTSLGEEGFDAAWRGGQVRPWAEVADDALTILVPSGRGAPLPRASLPPRAATFALTRREQEILVLLCQRYTDPEIAERLFLSPRTASKHVGNILGKLGVTSRREAAAFAARHGLV